MATLAELRDRTELMLSINVGDAFIDSVPEAQDINEAYHKTSITWDWPQLLVKRGIRILANNKKYALQSDFRKFDYVYVQGSKFREVDLNIVNVSNSSYAVDLSTNELIISTQPGSSATQYTMTNAESAGNTITVELDSVSGLSAGDEIYIDDATNPEVTYIQSVDTSAITITCRLNTSKSASTILYLGTDIIMVSYYQTVTDLSASGDTPLLPTLVHFPMLYYACYNSYMRLEQYDEAKMNLEVWKEQMADYWKGLDSTSTGSNTEFVIG